MGRMSRNKGKGGEREFARLLTDHGFDARRGVQYQGGPDSPDVVCDGLDIHWEVKRTERLRLYDALHQAGAEAPEGKIPVVAHRRNHHDWVVILDAVEFLKIMRETS